MSWLVFLADLCLSANHGQIWLGDLNYRIDMEDDILRAWIEEEKYKHILEKDQVSEGCLSLCISD